MPSLHAFWYGPNAGRVLYITTIITKQQQGRHSRTDQGMGVDCSRAPNFEGNAFTRIGFLQGQAICEVR